MISPYQDKAKDIQGIAKIAVKFLFATVAL